MRRRDDLFAGAIEIEFGEKLPAWYGLAWRKFETDSAICLPIPFHLVARALRWFYWAIRFPNPRTWEREASRNCDGWQRIKIYRPDWLK